MRSALAQHAGVARHALRRMFAPKLSGLLNVMVIGIALSLPAGLYALLQNVQDVVAKFSGAPQISLFLDLDVTAQDTERLRQQLARHAGILRTEFVTRAQALEQLRQTTGLADVIDSLGRNPLPDAFVVHPKQDGAGALESLRDELARLPGVEHAQLDSDWAYKLEALLEFGRLAVLILAALFSLALLAVTFNTIRLQILTRRDEIEIAQLIGATDGFIRRPFLYFGALQGLLGGAVACLIVNAGLLLLNLPLATLSKLYASQFELHPLPTGDNLSLLLFSMYLGWLGARLSVGQHLARSGHQD